MSGGLNGVLNSTIGAGLVGFTVSALLYGITSGQALLYYIRHGRGVGTWRTRCFVATIWILDTVHLIFVTCAVYYYDIAIHGNPAGFVHVIWAYGGILLVSECTTALVRIGYAHRIWRYNRKALMPAIVVVSSLTLLGFSTFYGYIELRMRSFEELQRWQWSFYFAFAMQLVADFTIATSMIRLCHRFHTGLRRFDGIIQTIILYIINTGILNLALVTLSLLFYYFKPQSFLFLALYWILAKLHVCSLLAVLNAEKDLIAQTSSYSVQSTPILTTALRVEDFTTGLPTTQLESMPPSDLALTSFPNDSLSVSARASESSRHSPDPRSSPITFAV
ncbi:hypothetical protein L226DRAFT_125049 [Lentinus tigrinus ALCF2SS1-7]|uniref:DUF6534 domain-containing protein n=1 Tax=Lentinus tigrinus ALCF2SS1-6 TaxID=1328759 RepID=A0A5C2ST50_9APHY|nr:hypothetical protein L227DRAFT_11018 [Lentinus tigrinus ALCF2SS1-6]RPD80944.1 hypothetical protein L226DRAFT_125049 [Lentinus tigrinus ALCF2SS1-7]